MRWDMLEQGEVFLSLAPEEQVWYLVKIWFGSFNWLYEYYSEIDVNFNALKESVIDVLLDYPSNTDVSITDFVLDIKARLVMDLGGHDIDSGQEQWRRFLEIVVVDPLADFGFLERVEDVEFIGSYEFTELKALRLTRFGQGLLPYLGSRR
jgi:hypothetical protein